MVDHDVPHKKKKVTFKREKANQHLKTLLKDFYSQTAGRDHKTSQKIEQALISLSKYPLQITSGEGCFILQGFDKNLCRYVDEKLFKNETKMAIENDPQKYSMASGFKNRSKNFEQMNSIATIENEPAIKDAANEIKPCAEKITLCTNPDNMRDAVFIALYCQQVDYPSALNKKDLIHMSQKYCTESINNSDFEMVLKQNHKLIKSELCAGDELYTLSQLGIALGRKCFDARQLNLSSQTSKEKNSPDILVDNVNPVVIDMPPGSYEIVMLVDKNEPKMLWDQDKRNVKSESRSLKVGDVIWVARSKVTSQELVLPYIIERKRMDDFASSIKDGRFHEQKFRLRKCGLRNVIYLVENLKGIKHCGLSMATLNQAKANTRVQDGFMVHCTDSLKSTKKFLNKMTLRLGMELEGVHLRGRNTDSGGKELMTFEYFNASSLKTKTLTIKELFIKMLVQLKGLSVEKALAITKVYNSPRALMDAYENCDEKEGEMLLANLRFNNISPKVSPAISKIIYMLFTKTNLGNL